jgi:acyl-[acyl carrier protein]--UDP-N-acetylglucosamine O-acyltransferase
VRGVNVIGLQRGGVAESEIEALREAFKRVWRSGDPRSRTIEGLKSEFAASPSVTRLVRELEQTDLGQKGRHRESLRAEFTRIGQERLLSAAGAR